MKEGLTPGFSNPAPILRRKLAGEGVAHQPCRSDCFFVEVSVQAVRHRLQVWLHPVPDRARIFRECAKELRAVFQQGVQQIPPSDRGGIETLPHGPEGFQRFGAASGADIKAEQAMIRRSKRKGLPGLLRERKKTPVGFFILRAAAGIAVKINQLLTSGLRPLRNSCFSEPDQLPRRSRVLGFDGDVDAVRKGIIVQIFRKRLVFIIAAGTVKICVFGTLKQLVIPSVCIEM